MKLNYNYTRLLVANYPKSIAFYRDILGLKPRFEDKKGTYAEFKTGKVTLALFSQKAMTKATNHPAPPDGTGRAVLIFAVKNVDKTVQKLQARGATLYLPPTDRKDWRVRTAHLQDPDGNLIEINTPLK